ncbi:dihydrofolate reductase family protein [Deinococcus oregonensis]|uniref:Dihydrofolate reductase family protein n=1 Tax=Deinococcus oregonensis TaxID=1805970 RepID=A0ABV6AXS3_9DEIO
MRKLVYYIASSLDGFIADEDGGFDAFPMSEAYLQQIVADLPETLPTHIRDALGIEASPIRFDTVLMGRSTYEPALRAHVTSPYAPLRQYIFSRSLPASTDPVVSVVSGDPVLLVQRLKAENTNRDIWLCGGGDLATQLVSEIDEVLLKLNPVILGQGVPLFRGVSALRRFVHAGHETRDGGVLWLRYTAEDSSSPGSEKS